ncbi:UDP-glucose/GDP-mannose dehydrogenase family protein [Cognatiyoonia sp. IB215446]|uniref:UDP-glucose/GDP-mannose dehydrogenase family protein n=1 Tax=Cognatiyoonia sp. IB215446 TaxID=3097355 RepID=UPI002A0AC646|nr:UDP-glucose/GDP-mannose dehydrogenase family protein [Cognatiyoonia sp. IB215446]MDX8346901.1 UDP-glucose/GDP-mannose dehydrogenase family protein [Cognatiyoonia sp. IB215446]
MLDLSPINTTNALPAEQFDVLQKPAISIVGLGYVGAVSTACLASLGHRVVGVDIDPEKVADIAAGRSPIHEKDLGRLLSKGVEEGLITASDDLAFAVRDTDVTFVSVGTPTAADGGCDYRFIEAAAKSMAVGLAQKEGFHVFVMRCSIPPGTTMRVMTPILERMSGKILGVDFGVAFNPEFLREGVAVEDFYAPPKTVIGATCDRTADILRRIYLPVDGAAIITSIKTAEMVKYVDNVWHATKVCFANEVGRLAKSQDVDSHEVMEVFCQDLKLNLSPYYLKPGFAYGGSCLPKEVRAVTHIAEQAGVALPMIEQLDQSNRVQVAQAVQLVRDSGAQRVAVLGLAFKPGTDDLRESPTLELIAALREAGIAVRAHDPAVTKDTNIAAQLGYVKHGAAGLAAVADELGDLIAESAETACAYADAIVVTQKTKTYADISRAALAIGTPVIDVVRVFPRLPASPAYHGIGW